MRQDCADKLTRFGVQGGGTVCMLERDLLQVNVKVNTAHWDIAAFTVTHVM